MTFNFEARFIFSHDCLQKIAQNSPPELLLITYY